ncbi:substrate-binding domain-containing protein [Micromonospora sp. IBHARD004]|uniref:substrate-binding domain-containing protein n=1 Tax=Micromonospora sp. IBHARD004 TaxID=3457764 RepID=UPI0040582889
MTTKICLACDGLGRTLAFVLSGGNVNDCTRFNHVMAALRVERSGPGRPRVRPDHVIADKGYSSKAIRADLRRRGIGHTIPERADQQANRRRRGSRGGRPPVFDKQLYKHRNVVERCFNRLKQCRSVATPEMTRRGVRIPHDVAIVGYDDIDFAAAAAVPLTSVRQPRHLLGRTAAELLIEEATEDSSHQHRQVVFDPELVVRDSSDRTIGRRPRRRLPSREGVTVTRDPA